MFHHDQAVPQITEAHQCPQQFVIISLMKSNTRLIQDIGNSDQPGADLCRKTDSLRFPAGECRGRTA